MIPCGDGYFRVDASVAALFNRSAETTPDARCIGSGSQSWTYAELRGHANTVAAELAARGMGLETVVGVFLPRGMHLSA
ncbi:AMP-binding protein, partial [Hyalangium sp.]|uniref:AMP-binding protein n=1 Tax=Hyalangium sp. TaxID=2028555 RepID=UPI0039C86B41